jgi:hypothetical protein
VGVAREEDVGAPYSLSRGAGVPWLGLLLPLGPSAPRPLGPSIATLVAAEPPRTSIPRLRGPTE